MVFSDPVFVFLFLPIVLAFYWILPKNRRNLLLCISGFVFYSIAGAGFTILLMGSMLLNFLAAKYLLFRRSAGRSTRGVMIFAISIGLLNLFTWKYLGWLLEFGGYSVEIALPIAISFYTFQNISFIIDCYRGSIQTMPRLLDYVTYIVLFPHLIAGPIVRFSDISDELRTASSTKANDFVLGFSRFIWGLSKKVLIADQVAVIADRSFGVPSELMTTQIAWLGAIAYGIQIYFDFSGYSDMAIGLARMFGFTFPENFRHPYSARTVTDFWRRWHISLSQWFRDYVYVPLGGNRRGGLRTYLNLMSVFLLTGLWHGANSTFLVWGLSHGALMIFERRLKLDASKLHGLSSLFSQITTYLFITTTWVLFRSLSLDDAIEMIRCMFYPTNGDVPVQITEALTSQRIFWLFVGLLVLLLPRSLPIGKWLMHDSVASHRARIAVLFFPGLLTLIYVLSSSFSPFLYFQF